jgi:hypothetical protein
VQYSDSYVWANLKKKLKGWIFLIGTDRLWNLTRDCIGFWKVVWPELVLKEIAFDFWKVVWPELVLKEIELALKTCLIGFEGSIDFFFELFERLNSCQGCTPIQLVINLCLFILLFHCVHTIHWVQVVKVCSPQELWEQQQPLFGEQVHLRWQHW